MDNENETADRAAMARAIPDGWSKIKLSSDFAQQSGPFYRRNDPVGLGLLAEPRHANNNGVVHGGALATLADIGLFVIAADGKDLMNGATLSLNLNYLRPGKVGRFIHCQGRIVREGSSIIFVEGSILDGTEELISFSGVIKRFRQ